MTDTINIPFTCNMLIDQNRYIGEDPVGYKCSRAARWESDGYLVCDICREMFATEPERITVPLTPYTKEQQEAYIKQMLETFQAKPKVEGEQK